MEGAAVRSARGRAEHHSIALADQIVDGVLGVWKRCGELSFRVLQFATVHPGRSQVAHVIPRNELIEVALEPSIREIDPTTNQILVYLEFCHHGGIRGRSAATVEVYTPLPDLTINGRQPTRSNHAGAGICRGGKMAGQDLEVQP